MGMDTGLRSYRCKVFDKFPRTNIPDVYHQLVVNTSIMLDLC